jgi:predicted CXXCH cytochrome family protein
MKASTGRQCRWRGIGAASRSHSREKLAWSLPKGRNLLRLFISAIFLLPSFQLCAEEPIEHPFIEAKDVKSETCLTCHPEKKEGKFVHSAVGMGCENCHQIVSERNKTTITLFATGGDLCAKCHEVEKDPVLHGPYKEGQCLSCRAPHASTLANLLVSAKGVERLCEACHRAIDEQKRAKSNHNHRCSRNPRGRCISRHHLART